MAKDPYVGAHRSGKFCAPACRYDRHVRSQTEHDMTFPRDETFGTGSDRWSTSAWSASAYLGLLAVLCFFCAPLFIGLRGWDLRSDEAIYAYAVDKILETGDWLTPRSIPYDGPFFEKPPLKFWMVAGAMRAGVLPHDEFGFRFLDALCGAMAFVYVFWLGRWLAGSVCGFVAVLVLFTLDSLLFERGFRSYTMDAALVLSYCGGIYHFGRWVEGHSRRHLSIHATAVGCYFVLGFMTKFVAALFLPLVCVMAIAWRADGLARLRSNWRHWILPVLLVLTCTTPWFLYQAVHSGRDLWQTMFGRHVYTRFTAGLDPEHLQPWHYYFSGLWAEMILAKGHWLSIPGVLMLGANAWNGRPWLARLLFLWLIVPFSLISLGPSKVFHYAYPFLPPIALGAGAAAAVLVRTIERVITLGAGAAAGRLSRAIERRLTTKRAGWMEWLPALTGEPLSRSRAWMQKLLMVSAVFAVALSIWTAAAGQDRLEMNGVELLRSSNVFRPIGIAAILVGLSGPRIVGRALAIAAVVILPVWASADRLDHFSSVDHPLRALRDCAITVGTSPPETHVYPPYFQLATHSPYYYLRQVGPWVAHDGSPKNDELDIRLYTPGRQTLVLLSRNDYDIIVRQIGLKELPMPRGLLIFDDVVLLTPGPFEGCADAAVVVGGRDIADLPARGTGQ